MEPHTLVGAYLKAKGNITQAAKLLGIPRRTFRYWISRGYLDELQLDLPDRKAKHHLERYTEKPQPIVDGQVLPTPATVLDLPQKKTKRYILTSAQNNTKVNEEFWKNLVALKNYYDAEMFVGTYTYNHSAYGGVNVKFGTELNEEGELWYDDRLIPYIHTGDNKNIDMAPGLRWCGRANILPTAQRPLSGFETYTGLSSGIFPHAKLAMQSIPSNKHEKTKFNYTTGTVTQQNYIQRKAGLKAEHHHTYGALIVEVLPDGTWFVRQINADSHGTIYDLCLCVTEGIVQTEGEVLAITWGDIHEYKRDNHVFKLCWDKEGILDTLKPQYQFMHDLVDFYARNHHEIHNHHERFTRFINNVDSVQEEIRSAARFLRHAQRDFCTTIVVDSNHDGAFKRWLLEADFKRDPVNAVYFLESQLAYYRSIRDADKTFNLIEWALRQEDAPPEVKFLKQDESFLIAPQSKGGGIECGIHGHLGPNGARGTAKSFIKIGRKANIGHSHSAGIEDGLYTSGITGKLDQGYNHGPSSWSQSHIITYLNGKRSIITISNNKWRG